jgi:hypothetical protein|tara:strand:+ start:464 stop:739 length:276 start_codon:yes stop_codon:yes gene_type:complete
MTITTTEAVQKMTDTNGKVFGVTFIKRSTGEIRNGSYRTGVRKGVTGEGRKFDPEEKGLFGVYDMNNGFRFISLEGLLSITVGGVTYIVLD